VCQLVRLVTLFLVLFACVPCARAELQPGAVQGVAAALRVSVASACLDERALEAQVVAWLGRPTVDADLTVVVRVDASAPRRAAFELLQGGRKRQREFEQLPSDCVAARAVLGLAIALAIDADVLAGLQRERAPNALRTRLGAQLALGIAVVPELSLGLLAGVEQAVLSWLSLRLDLLTQSSRGASIAGTRGVVDTTIVAAAPQLCAGGDLHPRARLALCSGAAVGLARARGRYDDSRVARSEWLAASAGMRLWFVAGIAWSLDVAAMFPLHGATLQALDSTGRRVSRAPDPVGALVSFGPALSF
jgi:hypothetical protein